MTSLHKPKIFYRSRSFFPGAGVFLPEPEPEPEVAKPEFAQHYLKEKMKEVGLKRQKLGAPSTTRWVERVTNLDEFVDAFEAIF